MKVRSLFTGMMVLAAGVVTFCTGQAAALGGASISSISPACGPLTGGTTVTITGYFSGASLTFGGGTPTIISQDGSVIVFLTPSSDAPGAKSVVVNNGVGSGSRQFTYVALSLSGISPASGPVTGGNEVTLTGDGFGLDPTVIVGSAVITNVTYVNMSTLTVVMPRSASPGAKDVTVVNTNGQSATLARGYTCRSVNFSTGTVDPASDSTVSLFPESGNITIGIPAGTFGETVTVAVATVTVAASNQSTVKVTDIGIEITNSGGYQPDKNITITLFYRDSDIVGLDESKLTIARYDPATSRWIPVPTVVYADQNKLVGTIDHLSIFAVVQMAPSGNLAGIRVYPNPYNPKKGVFTFDNLTADADIKIFTAAGELVRTVRYETAAGQTTWDGRNDNGKKVASGVYLAMIKSPQGKKIIKIAVEK